MIIRDALRAARRGQKRSVESVASAIGVHPNTLRFAEIGRTRIASDTLEAWARELGLEIVLQAPGDPAAPIQAMG